MSQTLKVPPDSVEVYGIESIAIATTPGIFSTGSAVAFACFLQEGGEPSVYIERDPVGTAVGYIALSALTGLNAMEVRSIAVLPEHQGQGHGKNMMHKAEEVAFDVGRNKIMLVTSPENTGAVKFYEALGYAVVREVENYYGDGTTRYVLEKLLFGTNQQQI